MAEKLLVQALKKRIQATIKLRTETMLANSGVLSSDGGEDYGTEQPIGHANGQAHEHMVHATSSVIWASSLIDK